MKKIKLIYNPFSGDKSFRQKIDLFLEGIARYDIQTTICRVNNHGDINRFISEIKRKEYYAVVVSGGDGTVNLVINAMMLFNLDIPLGIIPSGTANDFANYLKIPKNVQTVAKVIGEGILMDVDLGLCNDKYFLNVCAAGLFANISHSIDENFKNNFGKLAYYIKGAEQLTKIVPMQLKITNSDTIIEECITLFFVLNSAGTGGFENLSPNATVDDGLFDFVGFKAKNLLELGVLFLKIFQGDYLNDSNIIFFKDNHIKIEYTTPPADIEYLTTDIDGESGPLLPIEIKNIPHRIKIFVPKNKGEN